ncbi:MAG: molybdopterin-dependent oxidoreductase [Acidimicrobiales bacterium]
MPETWPVLHLEAEVPAWDALVLDGLLGHPARWTLADLAAMGTETRGVPVHCVWGWSQPEATWDGIGVDQVLERVRPRGGWVTVRASSGTYSSCLPIADAARGMLAWARDGRPLAPDAGGPLRFVGPPDLWGYKGVKWASRLTVGDRFVPGLWESRVADPVGRIPADVRLP